MVFLLFTGRRLIFRWPPIASDLLKGPLIKKVDGVIEKSDYSQLKAEIRGLLFGAHWVFSSFIVKLLSTLQCPPSRVWTKQLGPVYQSLMDREIPVEIIFCSSDRTAENFEQYLDQMPWVAFPYDTARTSALTRLYNVNGESPRPLYNSKSRNSLVGANRQRGSRGVASRQIHSNGRSRGSTFPLGTPPDLRAGRAFRQSTEGRTLTHSVHWLVFFMNQKVINLEGTPEDVEFSLSVLDGLSKKLFEERMKVEEKRVEEREKRLEERENAENGNSLSRSSSSEEYSSMSSIDAANPPPIDFLQVFYTGEDPICDHVHNLTTN